MISHDDSSQLIAQKSSTGRRIRLLGMPMVRKATISESVLMRLSPARMPINVAMGTVKERNSGSR